MERMKPVRFTEVTEQAGLKGVRPMGSHGASIADGRGTGLLDIYVGNSQAVTGRFLPNFFYLSQGGFEFAEGARAYGVAVPYDYPRGNHHGLFADIDNDGTYELFVSCCMAPCKLYKLDDGKYVDITADAGLADIPRATRALVVADFDNDGWLDVFKLNNNGHPSQLYHNEGNGRFTLVDPFEAGIADVRGMRQGFAGLGQGASAVDFDGDGRIDIYAAVRGMPNRLFHNEGDLVFREVAADAGVATSDGGDGVTWADIDNNGRLDLVVSGSNQEHDPYVYIYRNQGNGTFTDETLIHRMPGTGYTVAAGDLNHSGYVDLFVANELGPLKVYLNDGNGSFVENPSSPSAGALGDCRCAALGDLDGDGDLDVFVACKFDFNRVFRNEANDENWLKIDLLGPRGDLGGFGTKVWVFDADHVGEKEHLRGFREATSTTGYVGQNSPTLHFGLPTGSYDLVAGFLNGQATTLRVCTGRTVTVDGREIKV